MCYHIKATLSTQLNIEKSEKVMPSFDGTRIADVQRYNYFMVSGFDHPKLILHSRLYQPFPATWGLIPYWVKTPEKQKLIQNQTLNARIETLLVKPSFKNIVQNRAILQIDGFYEHHHFNKKAYPFYIYHKNLEPLTLACLYQYSSENLEEVTFSVVTTKANTLMTRIQNKPSQGLHRMPLILDQEMKDLWLSEIQFSENSFHCFSKIDSLNLCAHPVQHIIGKYGLGNVSNASNDFFYPELQIILNEIIKA